MTKRIIEILATGFYFGKAPFSPGTFGTLWGLPLAYLLVMAGPVPYLVLTVALILFASVVAEFHERFTKAHDPSEIVIDEIVGYLVAFAWLPQTWQSYLGAFLFFRLFDIWKPYPIGKIDRQIQGGLGTVLDDVAAGLVSNLILQVIYTQTSWLGVQWHG